MIDCLFSKLVNLKTENERDSFLMKINKSWNKLSWIEPSSTYARIEALKAKMLSFQQNILIIIKSKKIIFSKYSALFFVIG